MIQDWAEVSTMTFKKTVTNAAASPRTLDPAAEVSEAVPGYHTRALVRALSILDLFSSERRPLAVKDLHLLLELPKPTVSRLAAVLERYGYLTRRDQTYTLGPKLFELGSLFARQDGLVETSRRPLEQLTVATRQTSCLGLLLPPDIVHVVVVPSQSPVHYVTKVGSLAPAHSTGLGKALLARLSEHQFDSVLPQLSLKAYTPGTIIDTSRLRKEIATIRRRGYSTDDEETAIGLKCVAVAVDLPPIGSVAISLSGPAADFTVQTIPVFAERLHRTAAEIGEAFTNSSEYLSASDPVTQARAVRPMSAGLARRGNKVLRASSRL
jgi:IclR family acetate operon transcriptional repressor